MDRVCIPNLPKNRVKSLIIGEKYGLIASKIEKLGINVILLPEIVEVDPRLSGHADLGVLLYDDHAFNLQSYGYLQLIVIFLTDSPKSLNFPFNLS